jgi:DNA-binding MarR family transcriptional regulator
MTEPTGRIRLVTAIIRMAFLVNAAYAESGRRFGVTPQQGQLLCLLRPKPYGMGDLCSKLGLAKSTTTGLVDVLERDGLVARHIGVPTGRSVEVDLTDTGRAVADDFFTATSRAVEQLLAPLDAEERETARTLLAGVVDRDDVSMIFLDVDEESTQVIGE